VWAIRDDSIGSTFFDAGAATFFLPHLKEEKNVPPLEANDGQATKVLLKRSKYTMDSFGNDKKMIQGILNSYRHCR